MKTVGLVLLCVLVTYPNGGDMHMGAHSTLKPMQKSLSPQLIHQFETAEVVLYGRDVTNITMCPVVECEKNYNCSMDNSTMANDTLTMNNKTEICKLICKSYDEPCDPSDRRYMSFHVMNVLRDNGWKINENIVIGPERLAMANEVTRLNGKEKEKSLMFVFIKKLVNKTNGIASYDWSDDMGISAIYKVNISESPLNLTGVCGLNQGSISMEIPKYMICMKACGPGMFRHKDKCYKIGMSVMTYSNADMYCKNRSSKLAMLNKMSAEMVTKWFAAGSKYWAVNKADAAASTTYIRWNETMWKDTKTTPVIAEMDQWMKYDMQSAFTAFPLCQMDAKPNMPMMIADMGYVQFTLKPTLRKYSACCQRNVILTEWSKTDGNICPIRKMFPGLMNTMKNVTAAYFENEPKVSLNKTASKTLIIILDCTGDNPEYGSSFNNPFIIWMAVMNPDGSIITKWSYMPLLPMKWMKRMYQMYTYEITQEPDPTGYGGMPNMGINCTAEPQDRCYFRFNQFQYDNNLVPHTTYSWWVWPDISTATQLYASGELVTASNVCVNIYQNLKDKVNYFSGLLICDAPLVSKAFEVRSSIMALFGAILVYFV